VWTKAKRKTNKKEKEMKKRKRGYTSQNEVSLGWQEAPDTMPTSTVIFTAGSSGTPVPIQPTSAMAEITDSQQ
jgi:hypothetical protein